MGLYSRFVFPKVINFVMSSGQMKKARDRTLAGVSGEIFEIGFGTGLNLPFYPEGVKRILTADVNEGMCVAAKKAINMSSIEVENQVMDGEKLPLEDDRFDSVVCTWTLCSIKNVDLALREIHRILKPGGRFFFVEHGLAEDPKVSRWQHRLTPLQRKIGDGCHLNRDIKELIGDHRFRFEEFENYYMEKVPRIFGYTYRGVAAKE